MNAQQIKSLVKKAEVGRHQVDDNLYLRISTSKSASWTFRYKLNGKRKEATLAKYGDEPLGLPLVKARALAANWKALVRDGIDPKIQKNRQDFSDIRTVNNLANDWLEDCRQRLKYPEIPERVYRKDIAPHVGELPISEVNPLDIKRVLKHINDSGRPTIANDALIYCKQMFNQGIKLGLLTNNPASAFDNRDAGGKENSRDRFLTVDEIEEVFNTFRENQNCFVRQNYIACVLLLCLGVRKGELLAAPWSEFNLDEKVWKLPKERSKNGIPIDYPLPDLLVRYFEELKVLSVGSDFVFPNRRASKRFPYISPDTLNAALANLFKKGQLKVDHFTLHDLRRTCRTMLSNIGVQPHVAERCLNHKLPKIMGTYDKYDYFDERKEALQRLTDKLSQFF
ncbi:tyrosine-type recombinase/integrase [Thalassotalea sp. 1_MG-2023]|uniref:tyrosine-type recombinase/integrase n=1 Tax=Thalassotalea sp. 1_MG-2023 TaxID=3062680 RepID=UPI0026E11D68|nr:site-specific integrase [Thalassotalea sp. 1_MG-2023]MDO6426106.1 tyrosine-type recombinase/integrase [Thalassotalea sp. 1_MG-2023]